MLQINTLVLTSPITITSF